MYKRVLVPLDGSVLAEGILPFILDIAGPLDIEVVLLRVVHPIPPQVVEGTRHVVLEDVEGRLAEARTYLEPFTQQLAGKGVRVRAEVRHGDPVAEIIECAKTVKADLIAMTTHGRGGLGRVLFGSVAEAVLRRAEIPVFLMRLRKSQVRSRRAREAVR
ncbi:MAG: universal stress protein [Candidatus Rokuibacteriota bacterium]